MKSDGNAAKTRGHMLGRRGDRPACHDYDTTAGTAVPPASNRGTDGHRPPLQIL